MVQKRESVINIWKRLDCTAPIKQHPTQPRRAVSVPVSMRHRSKWEVNPNADPFFMINQCTPGERESFCKPIVRDRRTVGTTAGQADFPRSEKWRKLIWNKSRPRARAKASFCRSFRVYFRPLTVPGTSTIMWCYLHSFPRNSKCMVGFFWLILVTCSFATFIKRWKIANRCKKIDIVKLQIRSTSRITRNAIRFY